jgi:hypothetical protein
VEVVPRIGRLRYVGLTLPHVLGRLPYGPDTTPVEEFNFVESVDGRDHNKYLWMNAAYALGTRVTDAFARYGWCVAIRGVEGGGLVEGLPTHTFKTDDGEIALKCPTEIAITDRREKELSTSASSPGALQGHRLRRILRHPVGAEAKAVQHRHRQRQRTPVGPAAVHLSPRRASPTT